MSIRLGEYIVYGELRNLRNYSTHGFLVLRGEEGADEEEKTILRFELTGNCDADLKGKHIRFEPAPDDPMQTIFRKEDFSGFDFLSQHGPTGKMSAQGWVRTLPCTVAEFLHRSKLGEPPPTQWKDHLFLEWFGPNGRVTVELGGAKVEYCTREPNYKDENDEGEWTALPNLALPPDLDPPKPGAGPSITKFEIHDNHIHVEEIRPMPPEYEKGQEVPDDLQSILDAEAARIDRAITGESEEDADRDLDYLKRMDYCMERGEKKSFESLLGDFSTLPNPDDLDDEAVEQELKLLLARLVIFGVVLDVCEHFTPRDCYRLLLDDILKEEGAYEALIGTGWVQHYSTWENCPKCEEEMEKEFEKENPNA